MRFTAAAAAISMLAWPVISADSVGSLQCADILTIPRRTLLLSWKLRDAVLYLDGARICSALEPYPGYARCDWEFSIADAGVMRPQADVTVRAIVSQRSHLTGTGAWATVDLLECRQNTIRDVFTTGEMLYGGGFTIRTARTFVITAPYWLPPDANCCPSHVKEVEYEWDRVTHTFLPTGTSYFKRGDADTRTKVARPPAGDYRNWRGVSSPVDTPP